METTGTHVQDIDTFLRDILNSPDADLLFGPNLRENCFTQFYDICLCGIAYILDNINRLRTRNNNN